MNNFETFVETGNVSEEKLKEIALNIIRGKELSLEDQTIYTEKSREIEEIIKEEKRLSDIFIQNLRETYNLEEISIEGITDKGGLAFTSNQDKDLKTLYAVKPGIKDFMSMVYVRLDSEEEHNKQVKRLINLFNDL